MKQICKIFIVLGMFSFFYLIFPIFIGLSAIKKLERESNPENLRGFAFIVVLFCSFIGGIIMLCLEEKDLEDNKDSLEKSAYDSLERLANINYLLENKIISQEEFDEKKKEIIASI